MVSKNKGGGEMKSLKGLEYWLEANNKNVFIGGKEHVVKVDSFLAKYPYERYVISVDAEMIDKNDPEYLEVKKLLGDDWSTDILDSGDDVYADVYNQLFPERMVIL